MSILLMLVTVVVVALLTLAATSVRGVSRLWLRQWVERQESDTSALLHEVERPTRLLQAAGTGVTLTVFTSGALLTMADGASPWRLAIDGVVLVVLLIVIGQLLPRAIARRWSTTFLPFLLPILHTVDLIVTPFTAVARAVTDQIIRRSPDIVDDDGREGLEELLREGALEGLGASEEMAIITGVVQFGEKTVADVMTPRSEIFALDERRSPEEVAAMVAQSAYSRVPIYRDTPDQIVGMIHAFDVFHSAGERFPPLRPVTFAHPAKPANELLFELLRSRRQLAIVRDEHVVVGLVTMEDLLEELVGDIRDEHDEPAPRQPGTST